MRRSTKVVLSAAIVGSAIVHTSRPAHADPLRLHGQSSAVRALTGYQRSELAWGGALQAATELPIGGLFGVLFEASAFYLTDGDPPAEVTLKDQKAAMALGLGLGLRARPWGSAGVLGIGPGPWLQSTLGTVRTAQSTRLSSGVGIGFDFDIVGDWFILGPALGWLHIFQPDSELRPDDANLFTLGAHGAFDTAGRAASAAHKRAEAPQRAAANR